MYREMMDTIGFVQSADADVGAAMQRELARQRQNIELIASENIVSPAVMAAMGSVLTNKYAEGYPGRRYYGGCQFVDEVERIAIARACALFGANMPTCSRIPARRPTWPSTLRCWTSATPSWAWISRRAAT